MEIDLEVHAIIVVPVLLAIDIVANADEESLVLEVGLVVQFDVERKPIGPIMGMFAADIVAENCTHFRDGSPIIKGKAGSHMLVVRQVCHSNRTD
jgi:hypothetical protein